MAQPRSTRMLQKQKGFFAAYVWWIVVSLFMAAFSLHCAVTTTLPESTVAAETQHLDDIHRAATATTQRIDDGPQAATALDDNPLVRLLTNPQPGDFAFGGYFDDRTPPANLTSAQWKETAVLLAAVTKNEGVCAQLPYKSHLRASAILRMDAYVLEHAAQMSDTARSAWKELRGMELLPSPDKLWTNKMNEDFATKVLTVKELQKLMEGAALYEANRSQTIRQNYLVDTLYQAFMKMGVDFTKKPYDECNPGPNFKSSFEGGVEDLPDFHELPRLSFDFKQVNDQLRQAPLSQGGTSLDRTSH